MDKDQIVEWLSDNLSLESQTIRDMSGNVITIEIELKIAHEKETITIAQTYLDLD